MGFSVWPSDPGLFTGANRFCGRITPLGGSAIKSPARRHHDPGDFHNITNLCCLVLHFFCLVHARPHTFVNVDAAAMLREINDRITTFIYVCLNGARQIGSRTYRATGIHMPKIKGKTTEIRRNPTWAAEAARAGTLKVDTRLSTDELAAAFTAIGFKTRPGTLNTKRSRHNGSGPPFEKWGHQVTYIWGPSLAWARSLLRPAVCSTAELTAVPAPQRATA